MKHPTTIAVIASLLGALGMTANAQPASGDAAVMKDSSPGKATIAQAHTIVATVEAVDAAQRQITLKGPKGKVVPLTVGPDVRNLDKVKVGDRVAVRYLEALTLTLKKDGKALPSSTKASDAARAKEGERPGGVVAEQVTVTADVTAVDAKTGIVTLKGPKQVVDLHVADPEQLKLIKVGDQIEAVYTQALAMSVEPAAPAKK
jgi:ABC-type transport system substrate-binding protein